MPTNGKIGFGEIEIAVDGTPIGQMVDAKFPDGLERAAVDITSQDSPAGTVGGYREFIPGLIDPGKATLTCVADSAVRAQLAGLIDADVATWTATNGDGDVWTADGFLVSLGEGQPLGDKLMFDVGIKLSGEIGLT